jgi:hypothetical protein
MRDWELELTELSHWLRASTLIGKKNRQMMTQIEKVEEL